MRVMKARKQLKGIGVSIAKDLCWDLMGVFNCVKSEVEAWNGQFCCKVGTKPECALQSISR